MSVKSGEVWMGTFVCKWCDEAYDAFECRKTTVRYGVCDKAECRAAQAETDRGIGNIGGETAADRRDDDSGGLAAAGRDDSGGFASAETDQGSRSFGHAAPVGATGTAAKWVYRFAEGNAAMKLLLGGKGANLAEMARLGLPIPPGFTVTTEACRAFYAKHERPPEGLFEQMYAALGEIEAAKGETFGDPERPLLVSVRSGSVESMPGMMDTILNLGINDETVHGLARRTGNARFAFDCYRRFVQMFGQVVLGVNAVYFEHALEETKRREEAASDQEVSAEGWKRTVDRYQRIIAERAGTAFPQRVHDQLRLAVEAVFRSWNNARAKVYRKAYGIPDDQGTAVNIQSMVFGNMGDDSGTGVLFTRNPSTGEKALYGEYLTNAQGEDVVAGTRTPKPIESLRQELPAAYARLAETAAGLERHYRDMQDIEFTIERGELYILQTRGGKRTARAAVKIAVDLLDERIIEGKDAVSRIEPKHLDQLLHRAIDERAGPLSVIAVGLPASPGAASGIVVMDADRAEAWAREGKSVILVSNETTPEDIHGVIASAGVLTARGGMTSHAAVVARGMGKPCVCGCESLSVDPDGRVIRAGGTIIAEGDPISIDGGSGKVILGTVRMTEPELTSELAKLLDTADRYRRLKVYTNADTPEDAAKARSFGAEGVGLCRTEHMFMSQTRLPVVQEMILADDERSRRLALDKLLPMQQADFEGIFEAMDGRRVAVRLLDPPLHEFLPDLESLLEREREEAAAASKASLDHEAGIREAAPFSPLSAMIRKVRSMQETNPMLGLRGVRLGLLYPEIYDMQIEAIFRAADRCARRGVDVQPDIMVPLVGHANELRFMRELIDQVAEQVLGERRMQCPYRVGTMIEVPRAALLADDIAAYADFFSFGTNDLTQMTYGYSRDDAEGKFLNHYLDRGILPANPFQTLDEAGVGTLIAWAVEKGKQRRSALTTGICGEHGGDKDSIRFCHSIGLDYVSCSPYRVPYARIAAAQAALS